MSHVFCISVDWIDPIAIVSGFKSKNLRFDRRLQGLRGHVDCMGLTAVISTVTTRHSVRCAYISAKTTDTKAFCVDSKTLPLNMFTTCKNI